MNLSNIELMLLIAAVVISAIAIRWWIELKKVILKEDEAPPTKELPAPPVPAVVLEKPKAKRLSGISLSDWFQLLKKSDASREQWEELLIGSDLGPQLTRDLLDTLPKASNEVAPYLQSRMREWLKGADRSEAPWTAHRPWVLFVIGVNGVGKTTSIMKLTHLLRSQNLRVGVVGADTFRKAALEQLERGVTRVGGEFFSLPGKSDESEGADPSAVIFDGLKKFADRDVIIVDTSGRLHTKQNLLEELKKMKRTADKAMPGAPHDLYLVVDSTMGQNAVAQGRAFHAELGLTGLILTKLDGLSRGGTIFQLFQNLQVPIRFVGFGETEADFARFEVEKFLHELFDGLEPLS